MRKIGRVICCSWLMAASVSICTAEDMNAPTAFLGAIRKAKDAVEAGDFARASSLYAPVLSQLKTTRARSLDPTLVHDLSDLSSNLEAHNCAYEACDILQCTNSILERSQSPDPGLSVLPALASLNYKLKRYDKAGPEYAQLTPLKESVENPIWFDHLVDIYCEQNNKNKLSSLLPLLSDRIMRSDPVQASNNFERIILLYSRVGLELESEQLFRVATTMLLQSDQSIAAQWIFVSGIASDCCENNQIDFAADLYKFWTDSVKKKYGPGSENWLQAMNYRVGFSQQYEVAGAKSAASDTSSGAAIASRGKFPAIGVLKFESGVQEIANSDIKPGSAAQRLALLRLLRSFLPDHREFVLSQTQSVLKEMPSAPETAQVYMSASELFDQLEQPRRSLELKSMALDAIAKRLPQKSLWLRPYIERVKSTLSVKQSINSLIDQATTELENPPAAIQPIEMCVSSYFEQNGYDDVALEILQISIAKTSVSADRRLLIQLSNSYQTCASHVARISLTRVKADPNLDIAGRFGCLLLQPSLQNEYAAADAARSAVFNFDIQDNEIKNLSSTGTLAIPKYCHVWLDAIRNLVSKLPERRMLHFKTTFDPRLKGVVLSVQLQNGTWWTPKHEGDAKL